MIKSNRYSRITVLIIITLAFLSGILFQYYGMPGRILRAYDKSDARDETKEYSAAVDPYLLEIFGEPAQIYDENSYYIYNTGPEKSQIGKASYRYFWHYKEVANYLTSDKVKKEALKVRDKFWNSIPLKDSIESKRNFLKETIGIKDYPENGKIKSSNYIFLNDRVEIRKLVLESRINSISVPLYKARPLNKDIKGVVIAIHGHSGSPENVVGIESRDYTREFGSKLVNSGYVVYAPYVLNVSSQNTNIHALGMLYSQNTKYSIDLLKLLSVVDNIKSDPELSELPIAVYGISYGGRLSLLLAGIDPRIDIMITSGGFKLNRSFLEDHYALGNDVYWSNLAIFNNPFHIYFSYSDLANFVYPRPFIMEVGAFDLGEHPESIINDWQAIKDLYQKSGMGNRLEMIWFKGYHETAPQLTIPVLDKFVGNEYRQENLSVVGQ